MRSSASRTAAVAEGAAVAAGALEAAARDIAELAAARAEEIDAERALPAALVERIRRHGFFRLLVPARCGGAEAPLPQYLALIEALGAGDASTAWCVNQAAVYATLLARAAPELAHAIWCDADAVIANGPPGPADVTLEAGGHRLSGRWDFSSGCRHATWFAATTSIDGTLTVSLVPRADVRLVDVWQVQGLRGTGSFSFELDRVFVPSRHAFPFGARSSETGALYRIPLNLLFGAGFAAVALGNARAALAAAVELLRGKRAVFDRDDVRGRASVQQDLARAHAIHGAAGAFLDRCAELLWSSASTEAGPALDARIALRLAATHAIHAAADAVQIVYRASGSTVVFDRSPIQRRFQDAHVITQQVQGRLQHLETVGQHMLGLQPKPHFF